MFEKGAQDLVCSLAHRHAMLEQTQHIPPDHLVVPMQVTAWTCIAYQTKGPKRCSWARIHIMATSMVTANACAGSTHHKRLLVTEGKQAPPTDRYGPYKDDAAGAGHFPNMSERVIPCLEQTACRSEAKCRYRQCSSCAAPAWRCMPR